MAKPTLTTQVADLTATVQALVSIVTPLVAGQHATPAAVAEAVVAAPATPGVSLVKTPPPAPVVKSASDVLKDAVEAKGLAFARGGRTVLTTEHLTACVRVLKTGTPEILPVANTSLEKRHVTHVAIGRDGKSVITQYVYSPEKA